MTSPRHNRGYAGDRIESGRYKVSKYSSVFIGEPLKLDGSNAAATGVVYDRRYNVTGYTDTTGVARCVGLSENQIPLASGVVHDALENIEFRHFSRHVDVCMGGEREVLNKDSGYVAQMGDRVAPYPGGFQRWETGMSTLGTVKKGPIQWNTRGMIDVDVDFVST